jgi:hypothetical protein
MDRLKGDGDRGIVTGPDNAPRRNDDGSSNRQTRSEHLLARLDGGFKISDLAHVHG